MPEQTFFSRKSFTCIFLLISFFLVTISCSTKSNSSYLLTTASVPAEGGSISPASGEHDEGAEIQLQATANENWVFDGWEGDQTGSQNPVTVTMNADKSISARFIKRDYPLSVNIEGEGSVTENIVQNKTTDYEHGTVVELQANAADGWNFIEWQGDLQGTENPILITIDGAKTVTAVFELAEVNYTIIVKAEGPGIVSVDPQKDFYQTDETVTIEATPDEEMEFLGWFGTFEETDMVFEHQVKNDVELTAYFSSVEDAFVFETVEIDVENGLVGKVTITGTNYLLDDILLNKIIIHDETGSEVAEFIFTDPFVIAPRFQGKFEITFDFETTDEESFKDWVFNWLFDYKGKSYEVEHQVGEPASNAKQKIFPLKAIEIEKPISVEIK